MPLSPYPRQGQRIAPKSLCELLNVPVTDYVQAPELAPTTKLCDLDEAIWQLTDQATCHALADAVVAQVHRSQAALLNKLGERHLPQPPYNIQLGDIELEQRTFNCIKRSLNGNLQALNQCTIREVLNLRSFGIKSLIDLLSSLESTINIYHEPLLGLTLNDIDDQTLAFQGAAHDLVAMLHTGFNPDAAQNHINRMRHCAQRMTLSIASLAQFAAQAQSGQPLRPRLDPDLTAAAQQIAAIPGATAIRRNDPRLGALLASIDASAKTVGQLIEPLISRVHDPMCVPELLPRLHELHQRLVELSSMSLEDELFEVIHTAFAKPSKAGTERNAKAIARRYGWDGRGGSTLEEIAGEFGLSRERIRQICEPIEAALKSLEQQRLFAPVLQRALDFIAAQAPLTTEAMAMQLANSGLAKSALPIKMLLHLAKSLGCVTSVSIELINGQSFVVRSATDIATITAMMAQDLKQSAVISLARKLIRRQGAATVEALVAQLNAPQGANETGTASRFDLDFTVQALTSQADFAWLDPVPGWFWFAKSPRNGLLAQIEKVLAAAERIQVADLRRALARTYRRDDSALPQQVLLELCRQFPSCQVAGETIAAAASADLWSALSPTEQSMVRILKEQGPLMQRAAFEERCLKLNVPRATFYMYLDTSSVIQRYARGVYGLPGVAVEPAVIEALTPKHHWAKREVLLNFGWTPQRKIWLAYKISQGMLNYGVCSVPQAMSQFIDGKFRLLTADGTQVGNLTRRKTQAKGLKPFFRRHRVAVGDSLLLLFDLTNRTATAHLVDAGLLDEYQSASEAMDAL